jgi:hypothetical protein
MMNMLLARLLSPPAGSYSSYGSSSYSGGSSNLLGLLQSFGGSGVGGGSQNTMLMGLLFSMLGGDEPNYPPVSYSALQRPRPNYDYDYGPPPPPPPQRPRPDYDYGPPPPPPPAGDPRLEALKAQALKDLDSTKFTEDVLDDINAKPGPVGGNVKQYFDTVNLAYDWNVNPRTRRIGNGQFAGKSIAAVKTNHIKDKLVDWSLSDLEKEFGSEFGRITNITHKSKLLNLNATIRTGASWHSTPFHLGQAQKFLDQSRDLAEYQSRCGLSGDQELTDLVARLRHRAGLHYEIGRSTASPIIMDQDGNGKIDLTSVKDGVQFDIDGNGQKEQVAWTEAKGEQTDGWLALPDEEGDIKSGKQLFGNQWGDANGYERLKQFDDNQDGVIDAQDAIAGKLRMWQDKNHNGKVDAGEMKTLADAGVQSIQLGYTESDETDAFGNELRQQSRFVRTDAKTAEIANRQGITEEQARNGLALDAWVRFQQ